MNAGFLGALLRRAADDPARILVTLHEGGAERHLTHADLVDGGRRWAARLRRAGAEPGRVVLIALPLSADLIDAFLGALFAGCVPSLMPCPSPKQDAALFWSSHNALFARLGGGVMVTTAENRAAVATNITDAALTVVTPGPDADVNAADTPVHAWSGPDVACLQHSSGTTGLKKGVRLSFDAIDAQVAAYTRALGFEDRDVVVSWLPLYHDMGFVACLLLPLATGARTVMVDPFAWLVDPLVLFELMERHCGTLAWLPNFAFNHLVNAADDERRADLGAVRAIVDCSEPCKPASLARFRERFAPWGLRPDAPRTCYAMAETVFAVTQSPPGLPPRTVRIDRAAAETGGRAVVLGPDAADGVEVVSSGHPLPGVEVTILGGDLRPAPPDGVGEIAVRAPFLFSGYHLEPERSVRAFHEGAYLTGDLGFRLGPDLFVLGRRDDLLIILGRNVFAHEIEALLADVPGLKPGRALALGLANEDTGSQDLVVLAERAPGGDEGACRAAVRARLEAVLGVTVRRVEFVDAGWLIKSTSGKISREANRRKYRAGRAGRAGPA